MTKSNALEKEPREGHYWIYTGDKRLYTLEVFLLEGPLTDAFIKENPEISRKIRIRGDLTLDELHLVIFKAFNREEDHLYDFQFGGRGPMDPKAKCYVPYILREEPFIKEKTKGCVEAVTIGALKLNKDSRFGYRFDFGDEWWHQINVIAVDKKPSPAKKFEKPVILSRTGQSPPQYPDWDEEE